MKAITSTPVNGPTLVGAGSPVQFQPVTNTKMLTQAQLTEWLSRVREARTSEKNLFQQLSSIFALSSTDYDKHSPFTPEFFRTLKNKFYKAVTGKTAAEIIAARATASMPNMGLQSWKHFPESKITKSDITIAKNYLTEDELRELERLVSMYLDFAENMAARRIPMTLPRWLSKLDSFLEFNEYPHYTGHETISHDAASVVAEYEFEKFRALREAC